MTEPIGQEGARAIPARRFFSKGLAQAADFVTIHNVTDSPLNQSPNRFRPEKSVIKGRIFRSISR
jgi:hypothetical protein